MATSFDAVTFLQGLFRPAASPTSGLRHSLASGQTADIGPADLPPDWREHYEERAAIREYEGGQAREHAEAEALRDTLSVMRSAGIYVIHQR